MRIFKIYGGGEFLTSEKEHSVKNKYNGKIFAKTFLADKKILNKAIVAAEKARPLCKETSSFERYKALTFIASEIENSKKELAEIMGVERGKPIVYAAAEIDGSIQTFT